MVNEQEGMTSPYSKGWVEGRSKGLKDAAEAVESVLADIEQYSVMTLEGARVQECLDLIRALQKDRGSQWPE
jgi:hypothetical protein